MSIVAYYARLRPDQVVSVDENPSLLADCDLSALPETELIDLDKAWGAIAWLASPLKRAEDDHNHAVMSRPRNPVSVGTKQTFLDRLFGKKPAGVAPLPDDADDLRKRATELAQMEPDSVLVAVEGRTLNRLQTDIGYGPPALFDPQEVKTLSAALAATSEDDLRRAYDAERMDQVMVQPGYWVEEGEDLMATYILPNYQRLREFYAAAAAANQSILVWHG